MSIKHCPYCLSDVPLAASKCSHCGEWLIAEQKAKDAIAERAVAAQGGLWEPLGFFLILAGIAGAYWIYRTTNVSIQETRYGWRDELRYPFLNEYGYALAAIVLLAGCFVGITWFLRAGRVNTLRDQIRAESVWTPDAIQQRVDRIRAEQEAAGDNVKNEAQRRRQQRET